MAKSRKRGEKAMDKPKPLHHSLGKEVPFCVTALNHETQKGLKFECAAIARSITIIMMTREHRSYQIANIQPRDPALYPFRTPNDQFPFISLPYPCHSSPYLPYPPFLAPFASPSPSAFPHLKASSFRASSAQALWAASAPLLGSISHHPFG